MAQNRSNEHVDPRFFRKHGDIAQAALQVFAESGYRLASVDEICRVAEVSTRTLYRHFADKQELFATVLLLSAKVVSGYRLGLVERHLAKVRHLESDLMALGRALATPRKEAELQIALLKRAEADRDQLPLELLVVWDQVGEARVLKGLSEKLDEWNRAGEASFPEPELSAWHFLQLMAVPKDEGGRSLSKDTIDHRIAAGVRVFLHGARAYKN